MSIFWFGPFALDTARYELTREGRVVELPRLPMDILILLVERDGDLLTRSEIASKIWPDSDPADVVPRINTAINRIRTALGDASDKPAYLQTVIGKGYRCIATVRMERDGDRSGNGRPGPGPPQQSSLPFAIVPPARWHRPALIATLLLCAGGLLLGYILHVKSISADPVYDFKQLTFNQGGDRVTTAAISPDGQLIAFADADGVRLRGLKDAASRPVPGPPIREFDHLAWLPDGIHLVLSGLSLQSGVPEVWLLSIAGAAPVRWRTGARLATPAPQGSRMAFIDATGTELWVTNDLWQPPRRIFQVSPGDMFSVLLWEGDGHTLLMGRRQADDPTNNDSKDHKVYSQDSYLALNTDTASITAEVDNFPIDDACLKPNGDLLFSRQQPGGLGLWEVSIRPTDGVFLRSPHKLQVMTKYHVHSFSIASTGAIAAVLRYSNPGIFIGDFHQNPLSLDHVQPLTFSTSNSYPHSWTADSTGVYFEQMQEDQSYRIFSQQLSSHNPEPLASLPHSQAFPILTPDHRWIFFIGKDDLNKPYQLFKVSADHGIPSPVTGNGDPSGFIACALQGHTCVLRSVEPLRRIAFYALDPDLGVGKLLVAQPWVNDGTVGWAVSPDGSTLAYASTMGQKHWLKLFDLASGRTTDQPVPVHSQIRAVRWASDQKGWFVTTQTDNGSDLFYLDRHGTATLLHQASSNSWMVPSPDGRKVAFVDQNMDSNIWLLRPQSSQRR